MSRNLLWRQSQRPVSCSASTAKIFACPSALLLMSSTGCGITLIRSHLPAPGRNSLPEVFTQYLRYVSMTEVKRRRKAAVAGIAPSEPERDILDQYLYEVST